MRVHSSPHRLSPCSVVCLGTFDGMHRGHQALLSACMRPGHVSALATFLEHPAQVLAPRSAPPRLQTRRQREALCQALGLEQLIYLPFDQRISQMSPEAFVRHFLLDQLAPSAVVVGDDFRFGAKRAGTPELLAELLRPAQVDLEIIPEQSLPCGLRLSSTAVRGCLQRGELGRAQEILGRPYAIQAEVSPGDQRGRTLKIPTANLHPRQCLPPPGVYAGWVPATSGCGDLLPAVANLGHHPTFGASESLQLEVHVLDSPAAQIPSYGEALEFHLIAHLRQEKRFGSAQALRDAIAQDIERARALLDPPSRAAIQVAPLRATP